MIIANVDILAGAGTQTLGSDWESGPLWVGKTIDYAIQLVFTGTPAGTFNLQASCDLGQVGALGLGNPDDIVNWTDIADSATIVSAAGDIMWDCQNQGYYWVRVVYDQSSSTGTITSARITTKGG